ncbi:MAG TPA: hypothetical protein VN698_13160 [Bacteroidia bacterium]|nr:hypothetical protein [Bacteroidia bacterium]
MSLVKAIMQFYSKFIIFALLSFQLSNAQTDTFIQTPTDSIPLNHKHLKYEVALLPITLYYVPAYFSNTNKIIPVVGLQFKYFVSEKKALRVSFNFSSVKIGTLTTNLTDNKQYTKQYSVGFQHTIFQHKNLSTYFFSDFYYQTFSSHSFISYSWGHNTANSTYTMYDSAVSYASKVNSYNLVSGLGFKFLDRKHAFTSVESGLGVSYYTSGTQQATGTSTADSYTIPATQYSNGPVNHSHHSLPVVDTKVKGINLNACLIRITIGFVF